MGSITFFKILDLVVRQGIADLKVKNNVSTDVIYEKIKQEAIRNSDEWNSNRIPNLNYSDPYCRLAYLYIVAAVNANTFKYILETDIKLRRFISELISTNGAMKICAFGAGPGTELLALAKFFDQRRILGEAQEVAVDFLLLDKVKEWVDSWFYIRDQIEDLFKNEYGIKRSGWPLMPNGQFFPIDVTDVVALRQTTNLWNQDIYVLNFILSEIFETSDALTEFIKTVAACSHPNAHFVFIERKGSRWERQIINIAGSVGLKLSPFITHERNLDSNEQTSDLDDLPMLLGRSPRTQWKIIYSVGVKE